MVYIEVWVADNTYHKNTPLTYSSDIKLTRGKIVLVPLKNKQVLGIVHAIVKKPRFKTKPITQASNLPPIPDSLLELKLWMDSYYPSPGGITTQQFLPKQVPKKIASDLPAYAAISQPEFSSLTVDQLKALRLIKDPGLHILHGETGTGKTRVYIELAIRYYNLSRSSLIITPEIGLTSQLEIAFKEVFGDRVIVVHSGISDAKRQQIWKLILETPEPVIVIGARSALFIPLKDIGLLVIDESHEPAYKQDQAPHYHAVNVASKLASIHKATLVLGSATPLISDYYLAIAKKRPVIRMTEVAVKLLDQATEIVTVDIKDRSKFTKSSSLSLPLIQAMTSALQNQEQVLLFLNRRGTARLIFCERCGWQALCHNCDVPLVYHSDEHKTQCHICGRRQNVPDSCASCQNPEVIFKSIGTKAVFSEASRLFPEANIMRFDNDNKKNERLESVYQRVKSGEVDIIVGTQSLAKGLDLPKLGLVGVVIADTSLSLPDFSAQERTYQLLSQVIGRVGRGHRKSKAIIQTYDPSSSLIKYVTNKDWMSFYNEELRDRQKFLFPPFCFMLKLSCKRSSTYRSQQVANSLVDKIRKSFNVIIEGPAPAFHEKQGKTFTWQIVIKSKNRKQLTDIVSNLPSGWSYDIDPTNLL